MADPNPFDCVRGQGPAYFDDVLVPVGAPARLRSADHGDMVVLCSCTVRFGQRSFRSSAPSVWNDDLQSELKKTATLVDRVLNVALTHGFRACLL